MSSDPDKGEANEEVVVEDRELMEQEPVSDEVDIEDDPDLESLAIFAAEDAVAIGEAALSEVEESFDIEPETAATTADPASSASQPLANKVLVGALVVNVLLLVVFLFSPIGRKQPAENGENNGSAATHQPAQPENRSDVFRPDVQNDGIHFRGDQLYEKAQFLSRKGDYPGAIVALQSLLQQNPQLSDAYQRLVFTSLAHNLLRDGRKQEAQQYLDRIDRLTRLQSLPEDLVKAARRAATDGRGADMRRYFARFLLQQNQVRPDMRNVITEAYLRIADSYRIDAEEGRKAAAKQALVPKVGRK